MLAKAFPVFFDYRPGPCGGVLVPFKDHDTDEPIFIEFLMPDGQRDRPTPVHLALTIQEAAAILGIKTGTLYEYRHVASRIECAGKLYFDASYLVFSDYASRRLSSPRRRLHANREKRRREGEILSAGRPKRTEPPQAVPDPHPQDEPLTLTESVIEDLVREEHANKEELLRIHAMAIAEERAAGLFVNESSSTRSQR